MTLGVQRLPLEELAAPPQPRRRGTLATRSPQSQGILLVTELFPPSVGGTPELFWNIYSRLQIPVTVLTGAAGRSRDYREEQIRVVATHDGFPHWGVLTPAGVTRYGRLAGRIRGLTKRAALVHCARVLPEGLGALLARGIGGRPYVCWAHGEELAYVRQSRELTWLFRAVARGAIALIANSRNTAASLEDIGVAPGKIAIIYPGVDVDRFRPSAEGAADVRRRLLGSGDTLMISVGRLQPRKGHDLVIRALARMRDRFPGLRYAIAGDGEDRPRLTALVHSLEIQDIVTIVGRVAPEDLPACYAAADLFVHPNRVERGDFEGFGIVFLEAAAAGLPVIAGRTGGAPEAVSEGATALLVSGTDESELCEAIALLVSDQVRRHVMGAAGRERAAGQFSWSAAAARLQGLHTTLTSA